MSVPPPAALLAEALHDAVVLTGSDVAGYEVSGERPQAVVRPHAVENVAAALRVANERGWAVAPRGGGTLLDLGNPIERLDVVLDLLQLDQVIDYQPDDLTLTVQPGITKAAIDRLLEERGQMLALDVPLPEVATIGGALAANVSGSRRLRYGTARDLVIGMQVALPDGTLARSGGKVVKNVAGYDLAKLHIGGLGSCGVITQVTFKLWPAPPGHGAVLLSFDGLPQAHAGAMQILNGQLFPAAVEIADPDAARRLCLSMGLELLPERWLLATLLLGADEVVARQARDIATICTSAGGTVVAELFGDRAAQPLAAIRDVGRDPADAAALIVRAAVLPSELPAGVETLGAMGKALDARPEIVARPSAGIALALWRECPEADITAAITQTRSSLLGIGGTLMVERAPVAIARQLDAWGIDGPDTALMRRLKQAYDPNRVLNPGRYVAGI
jgi:glycolate oxidase FAD binding subunit